MFKLKILISIIIFSFLLIGTSTIKNETRELEKKIDILTKNNVQKEKNLNEIDLIYDFSISKFDKNFTYYQIIFNGTPDIFLKKMSDKNYEFNTQNKIWTLK